MADHTTSLKQCLADAELSRQAFQTAPNTNSATSQASLASALTKYKDCLEIVDDTSLFSPNEELEDISSGDLKYLLLHFNVAELTMRLIHDERKSILQQAAKSFENFINLLDSYRILPANEVKTYERYQENPTSFSTAVSADAAVRRQTKIARFKEEKSLKDRVEYLRRNPHALLNDDAVLRDLALTEILLRTQQTFQHLESIAQELQILSLAPPSPPSTHEQAHLDARIRDRYTSQAYSDRLDGPLSELLANGRGGPILNQDGRPMRPFTLLGTRQSVQNGVFGPDHSLPTMTIDEYLAEEKRRGGMIDGGGQQSQAREYVDEDDMERADEAIMKARNWDEYVEENPKGAGNTMNMG